jgi:hypothetical protein
MVNHPNRSKRLRFKVSLSGRGIIAAFNEFEGAIFYARHLSKIPKSIVEIADQTGLVAQFSAGAATSEFTHIDREYGHIR